MPTYRNDQSIAHTGCRRRLPCSAPYAISRAALTCFDEEDDLLGCLTRCTRSGGPSSRKAARLSVRISITECCSSSNNLQQSFSSSVPREPATSPLLTLAPLLTPPWCLLSLLCKQVSSRLVAVASSAGGGIIGCVVIERVSHSIGTCAAC